jgi:hypothetical protein
MKIHIPMGDGLACGSDSFAALTSAKRLCSRCVGVLVKRIAELEAEITRLRNGDK